MRTRTFITRNADLLGWTPVQGVEIMKALGGGDTAFDAVGSGRGPLSGPPATPYIAAKFVLAALAGGPQRQANAAAQRLYNAPVEGGSDTGGLAGPNALAEAQAIYDAMPRCPVTGAGVFGDALAALLGDPARAANMVGVEVTRGGTASLILFGGHRVRFGDVAPDDASGALRVTARIGGAALAALARDLREGDAA